MTAPLSWEEIGRKSAELGIRSSSWDDIAQRSKELGLIEDIPKQDSQLTAGFKAGWHQNLGILAGLGALGAQGAGGDDLSLKLLGTFQSQMKKAQEHPGNVMSYKQIPARDPYGELDLGGTIGNAVDWSLYTLGTQIPIMATMIVGGGLAAKGTEVVAGDVVRSVMARKIAAEAGQIATRTGLSEKLATEIAAKQVVQRTGALAGTIAAGSGIEAGSIYGDIYEKTGKRAPGKSAIMGIAAGSLEALPIFHAMVRAGVGRQAKREILNEVKETFAKSVIKQGAEEGGTEFFQTVMELYAAKWADKNQKVFDEAGWEDIINSTLSGSVVGVGVGGVSHGIGSAVDAVRKDPLQGVEPGQEQPGDAGEPIGDTGTPIEDTGRNSAGIEQDLFDTADEAADAARADAEAAGGDTLEQELAASEAAAAHVPKQDPNVIPGDLSQEKELYTRLGSEHFSDGMSEEDVRKRYKELESSHGLDVANAYVDGYYGEAKRTIPPGFIVTTTGMPFPTEEQAVRAAKIRGLENHEVVQLPHGFGLRPVVEQAPPQAPQTEQTPQVEQAPEQKPALTIAPSRIGGDGRVELSFAEQPDQSTRQKLKDAGFKWNHGNQIWHGPEDNLPELGMEATRLDAPEQKLGTWTVEPEDNGKVSVKFASVPTQQVRKTLRDAGFKWSKKAKKWVGDAQSLPDALSNPQEPNPGPVAAPETTTEPIAPPEPSGEPVAPSAFADYLYEHIDEITDNRALKKAIAEHTGNSQVSAEQEKYAQEVFETVVMRKARDIVSAGGSDEEIYQSLRSLYDNQPRMNMRSSTGMQNQAYSTPVPISYLVSRLIGINDKTSVYEPTAGNGLLLIGANPSVTKANEIQDVRAENLRQLGFDVTQNDASEHVPDQKFDRVIMNPPFGGLRDEAGKVAKVKVDGYRLGKIDHLIAARALEAMKDDGKAALIIGAPKLKGAITDQERIFFNWLYSHYNVTGNFEVEGDLYARQGAGWPIRVIIVEGRQESNRVSPKANEIQRVADWESLYDEYKSLLGRSNQSGPSREDAPGSQDNEEARPPEERPGGSGNVVETSGHGGAGDQSGNRERTRSGGARVSNDRSGDRTSEPGVSTDGGTGNNRGAERSGESGVSQSESGRSEGTQRNDTARADRPNWYLDPEYGANNKFVSRERALELQNILRAKLNNVNSGLDPELMAAGAEFAAFHIENGARKFTDFVRAMVDAIGEAVRPYLRGFYENVRHFPGFDTTGMTDSSEIEADLAAENKKAAKPKKKESRQDMSSDYQVPYKAASSGENENVLTPKNLADQTDKALSDIKDAVGGDIDEYVSDKLGYESVKDLHDRLMGLQVDTVAAWVHNLETRDRAVIITDQTGVGKGRQAGAIAKYAIQQGKIPIFITAKANLFTDMFDEMQALGVNPSPWILNQDGSITREDGPPLFQNPSSQKHKSLMEKVIDTGVLPENRNMLFLTYSQIQRGELQRDLVNSLRENAVFIMDEAHESSGPFTKRKQIDGEWTNVTTGAGFMAEAIQGQPVVYLSATYAKRPDNMKIYYRTDVGDAAETLEELDDAFSRGGTALQAYVAAALARVGQLFRRERSFKGITINEETDLENAEKHRRISDQVTSGIRAIIEADRQFNAGFFPAFVLAQEGIGGGATIAGNQIERTMDTAQFTATAHNLISQLYLALKVDTVIKKAVELHKKGIKPVIGLENTMGSLLEGVVEKHRLKQGDVVQGDFREALLTALERTRRVTLKNPDGSKTTIPIALDQLDEFTRGYYIRAEEFIRGLDVEDLPLSPLDYIRAGLERAGIKVGEITGRTDVIDYNQEGVGVYRKRSIKEKKRRRGTINDFQNDALDALIMNAAGSTGLSIHAVPTRKVRTPKQRHMLVVQPMKNVTTLVQILGRINRYGQKVLPEYTMMKVDIPGEKRIYAVHAKKMKSLNANTVANEESDLSTRDTDFMNRYGDEIVNNYLAEHQLLASHLDLEDNIAEEGRAPDVDLVLKATGRIQRMDVKTQEAFYRDIEDAYADYIDYLTSTGQNDLITQTFDLKAKIKDSHTIHEGTNPDSVFGGDAILHTVDASVIGKAPTAAVVEKAIETSLNGASPQEAIQAVIDKRKGNLTQRKQLEAKVAKREKELSDLREKGVDEKGIPQAEDSLDVAKKALAAHDTKMNQLVEELKKYQVGNQFELNIDDEKMLGVVTDVTDKLKEDGNQASLFTLSITFHTNSTLGKVRIPFSRIVNSERSTKPIAEPAKRRMSLEAMFREQREHREDRHIVSGNLLSGITVVNGRIVNFTDSEGTTYKGILLPKSFTKKAASGHSVIPGMNIRVNDPEIATRFLIANREKIFGSGALKTADNQVLLTFESGKWKIRIPSSKRAKTAGKLRNSIGLQNAMGTEFYGRGRFMSANFSDDALPATMAQLTRLVKLEALPSLMKEWVAAGGKGRRKAVQSFDIGGVEDSADFALHRKYQPNGLPLDIVERTARQLVENMGLSNKMKLQVVQSEEDLPPRINAQARKEDATGAVQAVYYNGTVYLVASEHSSPQEIEASLIHEALGHYGGAVLFGDDVKTQYRALYMRMGGLKGVRALAARYGIDMEVYFDTAENMSEAERGTYLAKEFLAHIQKDPKSVPEKIKDAIQRFLGAIRTRLRELGFMRMAAMSDTELAYTLGRLRKAARDGGNVIRTQPVFSRAHDPITEEAMRRLGGGEPAARKISDLWNQNFRETMEAVGNRVVEGIADGFRSTLLAERKLGRGIAKGDYGGSAYVGMRMAVNIADMMTAVLRKGAPIWDNGVPKYKKGTKGALDIFAKLGDHVEDWLMWMAGNRAAELSLESREHNLEPKHIKALQALNKGNEELFESVRQEYLNLNGAILDFLEEAGVIDGETRSEWESEWYVPFLRDITQSEEMQYARKKNQFKVADLYRLVGGDMPTKDLMENVLSNWMKELDNAMKNAATLKLVGTFKGTGALTRVSKKEAGKEDVISVKYKGKNIYLRVNDTGILRSVATLFGTLHSDLMIVRGMRSFKRLLTTGVTTSPEFMLRNFIRDAVHAWGINKDAMHIGVDSVRGLIQAFEEDEDYWNMMFANASFQGGYVHGSDPAASAQILRRELKRRHLSSKEARGYMSSLITSPQELHKTIVGLFEKYRMVGDKIENSNRLATYKAALKSGKSGAQAAFEARDLMDYSLLGNYKTLVLFADILPFFNARLQGVSRIIRSGVDDPALVAMRGAEVALLSIALAAWNEDDDRYKELPDWDRDANWHFFIGDHHFRIPKPFEFGIFFATLPERAFHARPGGTESKLWWSIKHNLVQTLNMNPIPQMFLPAVEVGRNRSFFFDHPIESMSDEGKLPEARYSPWTSYPARAVGKVTGPTLGLSPKQLDYLWRGYTGTLGAYALSVADMLTRRAVGAPKEPAVQSIADFRPVRAFYLGTRPARATQYQTDLYDMLSEANKLHNTIRGYQKEGRIDAAGVLYREGRAKLSKRYGLRNAQKQLTRIRNQETSIYRSRSISPKEKARRLDELRARRNEIVKAAAQQAQPAFQ